MLLEWKLRKIRLEEQKKLNETNLYLYKSITTYIQNSNLRQIEKEEILQQIIDMILQAQIENKPVNFIIGDDYEKFCKSIIDEYITSKGKMYKGLSFIQRSFVDVVLIVILMGILGCITSKSLNFCVTIDQVIIANVIALIIVPITKRNMQETSALISLYNRLSTINGKSFKTTIFMITVIAIIRISLGRIYGYQIFNTKISLYYGMTYLFIMFIFIIGIEIYKRVRDNI